MPRKFFRVLLRRRITVCLLIILQAALIIFLTLSGKQFSVWIEYALTLVSIFVVLHVVGENSIGAFKLIWVALILAFPVFGGLFYLMFNTQTSMKRFRRDASRREDKCRPFYGITRDYYEQACFEAPEYKPQMHYLQRFAGFPVYGRTRAVYLSPGEVKFEYLVEALKKAEHYVFLEYFNITNGLLWDTVLDILVEKAANGVDVRIIYDDVGCFLTLPKDYPQYLQKKGIRCVIFNPFKPFLATKLNCRDHRKIVVVDGKVAFTGGINLADEYINAKVKYGHWKDSAIQLEGDAAWSFTLIFLQIWSLCTETDEDYAAFYPWRDGECPIPDDGLVQPYADSPLDDERVGEFVYLQLIHNARETVYINTPYLVIGDSMMSALTLAAKRGLDVRIVTPHHPDKWYVHITTRSFYRELIRAGVKVYEYWDGFIHSKTFVVDGTVATVGTANLDYRSLYLSFECGVWMHKSQAVQSVHDDFTRTLAHCRLMTEADCKVGRVERWLQNIMRLLAPLL